MNPTFSYFYFIRHGETDHNVHQVYDDFTEVPLNENGKNQAENASKLLEKISLKTICSSPHLRAKETTKILLKKRNVPIFIFDELKECPGDLWRIFLASEKRDLAKNEWQQIQIFLKRVEVAMTKVLECPSPQLIVAHGGIYWALAHLLNIPGSRKIGNCKPLLISSIRENEAKAELII